MTKLTWRDADEIGYRLFQQYPDTDPMAMRFTELHRLVKGLDGFADDPAASSEPVLEAIQLAWAEYFHEPSEPPSE